MVLMAALVCFFSSTLFIILYALIIDINNKLAANIWVGIFSLACLSLAGIFLEIGHVKQAEYFAVFAYGLGTFVSLWRIKLMVQLARSNKKDSQGQ